MRYSGIAVAGGILTDVINTVSRYPAEGELSHISAVERAVGGCVPNVATDLKRLCPEFDVFAYGRVSDDENGRYVLRVLENNGVDTKNIVVSDKSKTAFTQVISIDGGQRTFFSYPGASADFGIDDIDFESLCPKIFHLGYFLLLRKIDEGDGVEILKKAADKGIKTSIDLVSENSDRYKKILPALRYTDYLIINETEGARLTDIEPSADNLPMIAERLIKLGVREKAIIHFKEGAVCADKNGELTFLESFSLPEGYIKGSTGAGDAFCAGALYALYKGLSDREVLNCGRTAAAMALREADAVSGLVTMKEAERLVNGLERK